MDYDENKSSSRYWVGRVLMGTQWLKSTRVICIEPLRSYETAGQPQAKGTEGKTRPTEPRLQDNVKYQTAGYHCND